MLVKFPAMIGIVHHLQQARYHPPLPFHFVSCKPLGNILWLFKLDLSLGGDTESERIIKTKPDMESVTKIEQYSDICGTLLCCRVMFGRSKYDCTGYLTRVYHGEL
jgi:hypothetical protein